MDSKSKGRELKEVRSQYGHICTVTAVCIHCAGPAAAALAAAGRGRQGRVPMPGKRSSRAAFGGAPARPLPEPACLRRVGRSGRRAVP